MTNRTQKHQITDRIRASSGNKLNVMERDAINDVSGTARMEWEGAVAALKPLSFEQST